jgi:hypothetical protein
MANIYTEQQVGNYAHDIDSTGLFEEARRVENYGKQFEQKAQNYENKAKNTYELALKTQWQSSVNKLLNNPAYSNNPVAMQKEIKNITDKMSSEVVDDDIKVNFLVNAEIKKGSYINNALANRRKLEEEQSRSFLYDAIYSGIDSESIVLSNGISGVGDSSDLANAVYSNDTIKSAMEAKNPDGSFIFSDAQRRQMLKDREMATFNSFKASFGNLPDYKRREVYQKIKSDTMSLGVLDNGNEGKELYLQDVISRDTYNKYKEFVTQQEENEYLLEKKVLAQKEFNEKKVMYATEQELSEQLDDLDPSEALKVLEQNEGIVSDKYYKAKQKALLSAKGITANTRAETATELLLGITNAFTIEDDEEFLKEADKILTKIEEKYAEGELSLKDKRNLTQQITKKQAVALNSFIEDKSSWGGSWGRYGYDDAYNDIKKAFPDTSSSSKIFLDYFRTINNTDRDYKEPERINLVKMLIQQNLNREFSYPRFNNIEEMRQSYKEGKIKKGDIVYVAGKRGKI